jgi:curved DNA-binding protein CbpA
MFLRVSEAYNVLGSPDSRRRYQERQGLGARPVGVEERLAKNEPRADARPMPEPAEALTQAERLIAEGKPFEAVALLEDVLPHARGRVRTLARLLRVRALLKTPSGARPAEAELREALQESPDCLEACLALGRLYRDHGLHHRAARQFARVLEIAPGHPGATAELRTLPLGDLGALRLRVAAR